MQMQPRPQSDISKIHSEYRSALMAFFLRRVWNRSEAEDLTQEVFMRLATTAPALMRSAEAYIFRIATNLLRDRARAAKVRTDYIAGMALPEIDKLDLIDPHRILESREMLDRLLQALATLPPKTRQIFLLFRYEHISQKKIAESFGISTSAVEKHIHRAMIKLMDLAGE